MRHAADHFIEDTAVSVQVILCIAAERNVFIAGSVYSVHESEFPFRHFFHYVICYAGGSRGVKRIAIETYVLYSRGSLFVPLPAAGTLTFVISYGILRERTAGICWEMKKDMRF